MQTKQKTWTELLGKCNPDIHHVDGNRIVQKEKGQRRKVLWTFDSEEQARLAFHWWWWGK